MSSSSTLDRVKPRRTKFTQSVADNSIGRLASKVKRIKEGKKREESRESDGFKDVELVEEHVEQIMCPGSAPFNKQRMFSKHSSYVQERNQKNRPLPDPEYKPKRINLKHSLNSLKRMKKNASRPLPTPSEVLDDRQPSSMNYKFIKTSKDGIEYCRVLNGPSPAPESYCQEESDLENEDYLDDTENLYSEIEDLIRNNKNERCVSEEDNDSASYSNGNSSNEKYIDKKVRKTRKAFIQFRERKSRNFEVRAMIHGQVEHEYDEDVESDHYATLTLNEDDDDDEEEENTDEECGKSSNFGGRCKQEDDGMNSSNSSEVLSVHDGRSISNLSSLPRIALKDDNLKTFFDEKGTPIKKYTTRQRTTNIYETLEDVKETLKNLEFDNSQIPNSEFLDNRAGTHGEISKNESESFLPDELTKTNMKENSKSVEKDEEFTSTISKESLENSDNTVSRSSSPFDTKITMMEPDSDQNTTSISITKKKNDATDADLYPDDSERPCLTSAYSIADLCDNSEEDTGIQLRGNTILIKVGDDSFDSRDVSFDAETERTPEEFKMSLKKCSSISSINILLDDTEDDYTFSRDTEDEKPGSTMGTIAEISAVEENCNEISYYNDSCVSISLTNGGEESSPSNMYICRDSMEDDKTKKEESDYTGKSIGTLSPNNELLINTEEVHYSSPASSEMDIKSLDSGNASDSIEDRDDSFDADSLADESNSSSFIEKEMSKFNDINSNAIEFEIDESNFTSQHDQTMTEEDFELSLAELESREDSNPEDTALVTCKFEMGVMEPILEEESFESEVNENQPDTPGRHVYQNAEAIRHKTSKVYLDLSPTSATTSNNISIKQICNENEYQNMEEAIIFKSQQTLQFADSKSKHTVTSIKSVEPLDLEHPFLLPEAIGRKAFLPSRSCSTLPRNSQIRFQEYTPIQKFDNSVTPIYQNVSPAPSPCLQDNSASTCVYENLSPTPPLLEPQTAVIYANTPSPKVENRTVTSFSYISLSPRSAAEEHIQNNKIPQEPATAANSSSRTSELPYASLKSFYNSPFSESQRDPSDKNSEKTEATAIYAEMNEEKCITTNLINLSIDENEVINETPEINSSNEQLQDGRVAVSCVYLEFQKTSSLSSDSGCMSGGEDYLTGEADNISPKPAPERLLM